VFEYDYENQLANVFVASAWKSVFQYDAFGRRRVRKEYGWSGSAWTLTNEVRYVYDGMLVVQERDWNNLALVSYTRGSDLSGSRQGAGGIGGLLARTDHALLSAPGASPSAHSYYHSDGNGNITALVDTNGFIVARYQYDPYGNLLGMSGPMAEANTYRFSSKEWDRNTGLYYYGFRYYEPNLQRWLNRDPIQEAGGLNLFEFVLNDPVDAVDSLGFGLLDPPGSIFSDPKNPEAGSDDPVEDFLKKCRKGLWELNKDEITDWGMNKFLDGKIGLCYDSLKDCVKDTLGLKLPNFDTKPEKLFDTSKEGSGRRRGFDVDIGLKELGFNYSFSKNARLSFTIEPDVKLKKGVPRIGGVDKCELKLKIKLP
jgi:RHS repeat-associated protein